MPPCPLRQIRWAPALALLAACGSNEGSPAPSASIALSGSASAAALRSGAASAVVFQLPPGADDTVAAELRKVASCARAGDELKTCPAAQEWETFSRKYTEGDDPSETKSKALVLSCLALVVNPAESVRYVASECAVRGTGIRGEKGAADATLGQLEVEPNPMVRASLGRLVGSVGTETEGVGNRVVVLLTKHGAEEGWTDASAALLDALAATDAKEPPAAGLAVAANLLKSTSSDRVKLAAAGLLGKYHSRAPEACKALLSLVETVKYPWGAGLDAMSELACKDQATAVVDAVAKRMEQPQGFDTGFSGADFVYLKRFREKVELGKDDKEKLRKAAEALAKGTKNESVRKEAQELVGELK